MEQRIFKGTVVYGDGEGKRLGFPTANLDVEVTNIPTGIYAGFTMVDDRLCAAAIIIRPYASSVRMEIHILGITRDLYGQELHVELKEFIRPWQPFANREELVLQIERDINTIQERHIS